MSRVPKDNSSLKEKAALRRQALRSVGAEPIILETHGGKGHIYLACYTGVTQGVVIEKDEHKCDLLASQRPGWSVYMGDTLKLLPAGLGNHLPCNFMDIDPWGEPWPVLEAFFNSPREFPQTMHVVVHDGLRQKVQRGGAWDVHSMEPMVLKYGSDFASVYLEVSHEYLGMIAGQGQGYEVTRWTGYYAGRNDMLTHWHAVLER